MMADGKLSLDAYFLDTTVQIERHFGRKDRKQQIQEKILERHGRVFSSTYVYKEYLQTIVDAAIKLHNDLLFTDDVHDAMQHLQRYSGAKFKLISSVIESLRRSHQNDAISIRRTLSRLLDYGFQDLFNEHLTSVVNDTRCEIARRQASKQATGAWKLRVTCRKKPAPDCDMLQFMEAHTQELGAIVDTLERADHLDSEMSQMKIIGKDTLEKRDVPLGNDCHPMGDAVILMEAPDGVTILTTNEKHYALLGTALGKHYAVP